VPSTVSFKIMSPPVSDPVLNEVLPVNVIGVAKEILLLEVVIDDAI